MTRITEVMVLIGVACYALAYPVSVSLGLSSSTWQVDGDALFFMHVPIAVACLIALIRIRRSMRVQYRHVRSSPYAYSFLAVISLCLWLAWVLPSLSETSRGGIAFTPSATWLFITALGLALMILARPSTPEPPTRLDSPHVLFLWMESACALALASFLFFATGQEYVVAAGDYVWFVDGVTRSAIGVGAVLLVIGVCSLLLARRSAEGYERAARWYWVGLILGPPVLTLLVLLGTENFHLANTRLVATPWSDWRTAMYWQMITRMGPTTPNALSVVSAAERLAIPILVAWTMGHVALLILSMWRRRDCRGDSG